MCELKWEPKNRKVKIGIYITPISVLMPRLPLHFRAVWELQEEAIMQKRRSAEKKTILRFFGRSGVEDSIRMILSIQR